MLNIKKVFPDSIEISKENPDVKKDIHYLRKSLQQKLDEEITQLELFKRSKDYTMKYLALWCYEKPPSPPTNEEIQEYLKMNISQQSKLSAQIKARLNGQLQPYLEACDKNLADNYSRCWHGFTLLDQLILLL